MSTATLHPNGLHQHSMFYENKVSEIIHSCWSHLNITNLSYRRFHREKGVFYIGNAFELQNVFWKHFNSASLSYLLRGCDGRKIWSYSKDSTETRLELEMFQARKSEYQLPNGLVKVFYQPEHFEIFHFASTEINLQKNSHDVFNHIEKINSACARTISTLSSLLQNEAFFSHDSNTLSMIDEKLKTFEKQKREKIQRVFQEAFKHSITEAETNCLLHLLQGKIPKEISYISDNSIKTIEKHLSNIRKKARCKTTNELFARIFNLYS